MKILLIGNGASVLESEFGARIDSDEFDLVCRINRGHLQDDGTPNLGFTKYAGERCDVWFCSDLRLEIAKQRSSQYSMIYVCTPAFKYNGGLKNEIERNYFNIVMLEPVYEQLINEQVDFKPSWPSTGIIAMTALASTKESIFIHGFDSYDPKYDNIHYFEDRPNKYKDKGQGPDHSADLERRYIKHMLETNQIQKLT